MTYIFDLGGVLINFKPTERLRALFPDKDGAFHEKLRQIIFQSSEWAELDRGTVEHDEAVDIFCRREPDYSPEIRVTMERIPELLTPIQDTVALLPKIKAAGHRLYYLSNYHKKFSQYALQTYPFFELFDGGVFSCDIHINKPSPGIYRHLLNTYRLDAKSCVFFDDLEPNVQAAEQEGMTGVVVTDTESVRKTIFTQS
jgi:putative hydrolase of the HAD superfamily